jgi:hypothetical protein
MGGHIDGDTSTDTDVGTGTDPYPARRAETR